MDEIGVDRIHGRRIGLFQLSHWAWHEDAGATPFILFVGARASADGAADIRRFAGEAIAAGCGYVCAWGEGCELVHDVFDDAAIAVDRFVMSTWHSDESLASALYFSLTNAWPDEDEFPDATEAPIVLAVEEPWIADVRRLVADQDELLRLVLVEEK